MNSAWLMEMISRHRNEERVRPVVVGVIANLSGTIQPNRKPLPPVSERQFREVAYTSLERLINAIKPGFTGRVTDPSDVKAQLPIDLTFTSLADFHPMRIVQRVPALVRLQAACMTTTDSTLKHKLNQTLQAHLNQILHAPELKALEATWRGLHHLLTELPDGVRVRVLDLNKRELWKKLRQFKGMSWDHSPLFKRIYEEEFATFGGQPFHLIIGDYSFSHQPDDCETLEDMGQIMAASHCVFMGAASPHLFGLRSMLQASGLQAPTRLFNADEYIRWRKLCASQEAAYLSLVLPRILLRPPYDLSTEAGLDFQEDQTDPENLLWGNPAYALGADVIRAFAQHRFYAINENHPSGGIIHHLATAFRPFDSYQARSSLEYEFADRTRQELEALGLTTLIVNRGSGRVTYSEPINLYQSKDEIPFPHILLKNHLVHAIRSWARQLTGAVRKPEELLDALRTRFSNETDPAATGLQQRIETPYSRIDFSVDRYDKWTWDPDFINARIQIMMHDHRYNPIDD